MRNILPIVLDSLFLFFASLIICVFILNYFLPHPLPVVISLTVSGMICMLGANIFLSRSSKKFIEKQDKKLYAETLIRLNLMKKERLVNLVVLAMQIKDAKILKDRFYDNNSHTLYLFKFGFETLTKADVVKAFNLTQDKIVFLCHEYSDEVKSFADRFNGKIILKDGKYLFNLLKERDLLPKNDFSGVYNEKNKPIFKKRILQKRNAKKFLFFGVILCFFSLFVPYKFYYVVWGVLMISFSIYLKLFGKAVE